MAATREDCETVAGKEQLASDSLGRDRIVGCDIVCDPGDVGKRPGSPEDRHFSARFGGRRVELAIGEKQQPGADFLVRDGAWVGIRFGDGRRQGARLGLCFIVVDQGGGSGHVGMHSVPSRQIALFVLVSALVKELDRSCSSPHTAQLDAGTQAPHDFAVIGATIASLAMTESNWEISELPHQLGNPALERPDVARLAVGA